MPDTTAPPEWRARRTKANPLHSKLESNLREPLAIHFLKREVLPPVS